jgi:hypothetical protein
VEATPPEVFAIARHLGQALGSKELAALKERVRELARRRADGMQGSGVQVTTPVLSSTRLIFA